MASTRNTIIPGIWAEAASTTIPTTPVAGTPYRDSVNGADGVTLGWPFNTIVDSRDYNEILFRYSTVLQAIDRRGVLGWSSLVDYDTVPAVAFGSDGNLYISIGTSGPNFGGAADPISSPLKWVRFFGSQSKTDAGYKVIPDGSNSPIIVQWGVLSGVTPLIAWPFPIAFPNAVFKIVGSMTDKDSGTRDVTPFFSEAGRTLTQFEVELDGYDVGNYSIDWIAIGN